MVGYSDQDSQLTVLRLDAVPTAVPNPNSKICMFNRNDNNEVVLALNPSSSQRNPITLATSTDGFTWAQFAVLANNASVSESCMLHIHHRASSVLMMLQIQPPSR